MTEAAGEKVESTQTGWDRGGMIVRLGAGAGGMANVYIRMPIATLIVAGLPWIAAISLILFGLDPPDVSDAVYLVAFIIIAAVFIIAFLLVPRAMARASARRYSKEIERLADGSALPGHIYEAAFGCALARGMADPKRMAFDLCEWRRQLALHGLRIPRTVVIGASPAPDRLADAATEFVEPEHIANDTSRMLRLNMALFVGFFLFIGSHMFVTLWRDQWIPISRPALIGIGAAYLVGLVIAAYLFAAYLRFLDRHLASRAALVAPGRVAKTGFGFGRRREASADHGLMIVYDTPLYILCQVVGEAGRVAWFTQSRLDSPRLRRLCALWHYPGPPAPPIFEDLVEARVDTDDVR